MDVTQYLHPLMQRGMTKDPNSVYNALINALNSPLNNAESDILRSKTNIMLAQAPEDWLDTFGSWLGLKRKDKEPDNVYRKRLMEWVLADKNDVSSIRNAIANFLNISSDCVYVYEPYTDMLYYNKLGSDYNSLKYFSSSYYNYCVIDVQIDNTFPIREIQDIINLFRPAGVIYVLTMNINSFNHNAPIIDMSEDGSTPMFYDETYYAGFNQRVQALITPGLSDDITVTNPFFWSTSLSELNEGREYQNEDSQFNDYMVLGEYYNDYDPNDTDTFTDGRVYAKNYSLQDRNLMAKRDNDCLKFNIGKFDSDYQPLSFTTTLNQGSSYNNSVYSVNSNSKGITFTFSNLDPNFTYILFYHTITGSLDIDSVDSAVVNGDINMEYKVVYPGGDNGNITFTSTKGISSFNNVSLIKLNSGDKTTTTYNYNTSMETAYGLGGVANVMGALQMHFSLPSNINKNNLLTDYYSESYLTIRMKADIPIKSTHNIDIYIYDFSANVWSLFRTISVDDNSYIEQNIKINDYSNILNSNGCLFYKIVSDVDIDVDYFGLSFSNYVYNEPKLNSYFNSIELIDTTMFNDGKLGCWDRNYTKDINLWKFNDTNISGCWIDFNTGGLNPSSNDICSAEIECKPNTTYTLALPLCSTNLGNNVVVFYDKNHKVISSPLHGGGSSSSSFDSLPKATFTSPENAAFMRVSLNTGNNNKDAVVSLVEGNEYIPYPQYLSIDSNTTNLTGNDGLGRFIMSNTLKHVCYGDTYQVDCWINTTSGATIGVVDPDNKYFYASNTLSTSDSGWQEITGDITINVYNNTNAVYPLIEIKDDDCSFEISNFTITKKQ